MSGLEGHATAANVIRKNWRVRMFNKTMSTFVFICAIYWRTIDDEKDWRIVQLPSMVPRFHCPDYTSGVWKRSLASFTVKRIKFRHCGGAIEFVAGTFHLKKRKKGLTQYGAKQFTQLLPLTFGQALAPFQKKCLSSTSGACSVVRRAYCVKVSFEVGLTGKK